MSKFFHYKISYWSNIECMFWEIYSLSVLVVNLLIVHNAPLNVSFQWILFDIVLLRCTSKIYIYSAKLMLMLKRNIIIRQVLQSVIDVDSNPGLIDNSLKKQTHQASKKNRNFCTKFLLNLTYLHYFFTFI